MKKLALLLPLALVACESPDYPMTRQAALDRGQNVYYQASSEAFHSNNIIAIYIDTETGCEYWRSDGTPRNHAQGQQVCLPIDDTPHIV